MPEGIDVKELVQNDDCPDRRFGVSPLRRPDDDRGPADGGETRLERRRENTRTGEDGPAAERLRGGSEPLGSVTAVEQVFAFPVDEDDRTVRRGETGPDARAENFGDAKRLGQTDEMLR